MIRYALVCAAGHEFEGWFAESADYDRQAAEDVLTCPVCSSPDVRKGVMSPAISGAGERGGLTAVLREAMGQIRRHVEDNFDYVGSHFAKEARAIHSGDADRRSIYGEASPSEVKSLVADGVPVAPLPPKPPEPTDLN